MDELRSFYASGGKHIKLKGGQTSGLNISSEDVIEKCNRKEAHRSTALLSGTDYAAEVKEREKEEFLKNEAEREKWESISGGLESLEQLSLWGESQQNIAELTEEAMTEVYSKYSFKVKEESINLAITEYKQQILDRIQGNQVVIIEGPTGCGKTTQVPQWILDDCFQKRKHCKIIITQPRRIAAISIAKRVAQERGWDVGGVVGYQVGLENRTTNDTRIHYVTTGVLLQKLVNTKNLNEYTHIILDEVHERGQEMDFLLLVIKKLLFTSPPGVKVILMSATFNYEEFAEYFAFPTSRGQSMEKATWVRVEKKKPMFAVKTFYLNHLDKFGSIVLRAMPKDDEAFIQPDMYKLVIKLVCVFDGIDKAEDNYSDADAADVPSVLIFLPGIHEIEELFVHLTDTKLRTEVAGPESARHKWWVLPLHSTITADEQVRVFQRAPPGHRKVILSTNIAESSITVPDIKYVVDFCLMKILVANEQTNFTSLQLQWASKTNCVQRAGRAGRVRDGRVYRLVTDKFYESLPKECPPEIQRCPLERLVLLSKLLDMGPPRDVLASAMSPPDLSNIHRTVLVLKEVGALKKTLDGEPSSLDGDLTYAGRIMAHLPVDVHASKLIVLGHIFGCLEECVVMAAAMTVKEVFMSPFRNRLNAYNSKLTWADGSTSDLIAYLNAYKVWTHMRKQQLFKHQGEAAWARRLFVQVRALRELDELARELRQRLAREGVEPPPARGWSKAELPLLLKVVIAGAFYPHYFVQLAGTEDRELAATKGVGGHDPRTTVYLKDFPLNQPGALYAASIRKAVFQLIGDEPRVSFDNVGQKVYLTFDDNQTSDKKNNSGNPSIPGKVVLPVYKAIKARQLQLGIRIPLLPPERANQLVAALATKDEPRTCLVPRLPEIDETHIPIKISYLVNCGRFWAQYDDESSARDQRMIMDTLNKRPLLAYTGTIKPGQLFAAPYSDGSSVAMYRATVRQLLPGDMVLMFYIDFGNLHAVSPSSLRSVPDGACASLPPLAMDCSLAQLAPSSLLDTRAHWTPQATARLTELCAAGRLLAKVYSVSHGVVSVELLASEGRISVNKDLLDRGLAQPADESLESKRNHDLRETANYLDLGEKRAYNKQQEASAAREAAPVAAPPPADCSSDVQLRGPHSPLETSVHNLMYASSGRQVGVEWHSVNSVLLDAEPQHLYQRLLVAGAVGVDAAGGRLRLRHTTLLPDIPGLPAIMALIFCPVAELRRDSAKTRYVSALCGLGADEEDAPLFAEHDLLVDIDVDLDVEDMSDINHIRHLMEYCVTAAPSDAGPRADDQRAKIPGLLRTDLMKLLGRRRKQRGCTGASGAWQWGSTPADELLELEVPELAAAELYPLHAPPELRAPTREELLQLKMENDALVAKVMRTPRSGGALVECRLCGTEPLAVPAMRLHLYSRAHLEREDDFRIFNS